MTFLGRGLLVAMTALLLTALAFAQNDGAGREPYGNDLFQTADRDRYANDLFQTADPQFMKEATQDGMAKIHLAYLALQNAQNEQVKLFAQQILTDYGKAQEGLIYIANQQFVMLPDTLDPKQLDTYERLSELQGAEFDKAYMEAMLKGDKTAASRFKKEATKGDQWASHMLPTLESNLTEAQKVALAVGVHSTVTSEEQRIPDSSKPVNAVSEKP